MIINPKLGDKVLSSNVDSTLNEYRLMLEQNNKDSSKPDETNESQAPPCTWMFYEEKKNDQFYQMGYRIKLTHQKVIFNN